MEKLKVFSNSHTGEKQTISNNNITMLLIGVDRDEKISTIGALSNVPDKVITISQPSTTKRQMIVDWKFTSKIEGVQLSKIYFDFSAFIGNNVTNKLCTNYNNTLEKNYSYLHDLLGFEYQTCLDKDITKYINEIGRRFMELCKIDSKQFRNLMSSKESSKFIYKVEIAVSPSREFKSFLDEKNLDSFTVRDALGIINFTDDDYKRVGNLYFEELGLDKIDSAMILCNSIPFSTAYKNLYSNVYSTVLNSVPVFITAKHDGIIELFEKYEGKQDDFYKSIKNNKNLFNRIVRTHFVNAFKLLEDFGVMESSDTIQKYEISYWKFKYDYNNLSDILYFSPVTEYPDSIAKVSLSTLREEQDSEYSFYCNTILNNFEDAINKTCEYNKYLDEISKSSVNDSIFYYFDEYANEYDMYPRYKEIPRELVNQKIADKTLPILGTNNAVTTIASGKIKYLAALTSAVTVVHWINKLSNSFVLSSKLKDKKGNLIIEELDIDKQESLIRKYIMNKCYKNVETSTYFRHYVLFDRNKVKNAIEYVQENGKDKSSLDNLTAVVKVIVSNLFK